MPGLGKRSRERLQTCTQELQELITEVSTRIEIAVLCGHRTEEDQEKAKEGGFSKVSWPNSKHNALPSNAVDISPYPLDWSNLDDFKEVYDVVMEVAKEKGLRIRAGADFDMDGDLTNNRFQDWPHYELID